MTINDVVTLIVLLVVVPVIMVVVARSWHDAIGPSTHKRIKDKKC